MMFVNQTSSSNERMYRDYSKLLTAYGETEVKNAIDGSETPEEMYGYLTTLHDLYWPTLKQNPNVGTGYVSMTLRDALTELPLSSMQSEYYGSVEGRRVALNYLIDSVPFTDSEILYRFVTKNYDYESITKILTDRVAQKITERTENVETKKKARKTKG